MKKILFIVFLMGIFSVSFAQIETNKALLEFASIEYSQVQASNYNQALAMAKQKSWPLSFLSKNGNQAVLVGIDDFGYPKYYITQNNTIAAATTRANQLWPGGRSGLNLSGSSASVTNKLGIWDGGKVLNTHVELTGRVLQKDLVSAFSDHSTHVAGTMMSSGVNPLAKGMVFGLQNLVAYDYSSDISEMLGEASNLVLSNHSYGIISGWNYNSNSARWEFNGKSTDNEDYKFGYYSNDAMMLDSIAYNAPNYLIVKAAGNNRTETGPAVGSPYYRFNGSNQMTSAGNRPGGISSNDSYGTIPWDANAKNILTVGAISGLPGGYNRKEDPVISDFSSFGPTDDGRIKPDLVADGVGVLSSIATSNKSYASYDGTSMATPNATGSLLLLQEYWSKLKPSTFMRSATLKGLAIHTADEAGYYDGPDYSFGWGVLNVENAAAAMTAAISTNNADTSVHLIYENNLLNGQTFTKTVTASGKGQLSATICWTDVKGTVETINVLNNPAKKLVNDLDIVIKKGTSVYQPWVMDPNSPNAAATKGDNTIDNVEKVSIDSTIPGQTYTITVSNKGTLARGQQAYSLLVSGVGGNAYCSSAPTSTAGARIDSVAFSTIRYKNPTGCTSYTNNTNIIADIESAQVIPITVLTGTCDASANPRIVTVYIDYNNNGVFEATEKVAQSAVLNSATGTYTTTITTPSGLTVGNICLMRIIVQETSNIADIGPCSSSTYLKGETEDFRLRIAPPSNDLSIDNLLAPLSGNCASDNQFITISLKNNGTTAKSNVPITVVVKNGTTTVASFTSTYSGTIAALSSTTFSFPKPFITTPGTNYTITTNVSAVGDQITTNNDNITIVTIPATPAGPAAKGTICNGQAILSVTAPVTGSNYFWYNSPTIVSPFANGSIVNSSNIPTNNTFYVGSEFKGSIGPLTKMVFPGAGGGYNANAGLGSWVNFSNTVPLNIESARMYIGSPGQIEFVVSDFLGYSSDGLSFNYRPLSRVTLNVQSTSSVEYPSAGNASNNIGLNPSDTGAIFQLNLSVPTAGEHMIMVNCMNGASIYRNNNITTSPYPFSLPNVMSITNNYATSTANPNAYQNFYYFFYDMRVNTIGCVSNRTAVIATATPTPVITQVADSLVSSASTRNQWYINDSLIVDAINASYKPTRNGAYKTVTIDVTGCTKISNTINYVVTALADVLAREIKLTTYPNPSRGRFRINFEMTVKKDLSVEILNAKGQKVFAQNVPSFVGKYNQEVDLSNASSDFYVLKIQHNSKTYLQKILIEK